MISEEDKQKLYDLKIECDKHWCDIFDIPYEEVQGMSAREIIDKYLR